MTSAESVKLIYALILLVFVSSGFLARRLPLWQSVKYVFAWIAIFGLAFAIFSFRGEAVAVWHNLFDSTKPDRPQNTGEMV